LTAVVDWLPVAFASPVSTPAVPFEEFPVVAELERVPVPLPLWSVEASFSLLLPFAWLSDRVYSVRSVILDLSAA